MEGTSREVSVEEAIEGVRRIWAQRFAGLTKLDLDESLRLGVLADQVRMVINRTMLPEHPLKDIVRAALNDVVEHAEAFELLAGREASVLHARQVEETTAILDFILQDPARYNEFNWRWENFRTIHAIRNRLFNLNKPLHPEMEEWIQQNQSQLQAYAKFKSDPAKERDRWQKYSNWLYPISIREMFEKTNKTNAYLFETYDWASHSTHFSPQGEHFKEFVFDHGSYFKTWHEFTAFQIHSLLRILLPVAIDQSTLRYWHGAYVLATFYKMFRNEPDRAARIIGKSERLQFMVNELVRPDFDFERLLLILLGKQPDDPLVIKLGDR
jgi:hypothetical protein